MGHGPQLLPWRLRAFSSQQHGLIRLMVPQVAGMWGRRVGVCVTTTFWYLLRRVSGQDATFSPWRFQRLPLSSIRPTGWLLEQLRLQGDGLHGALPLFYKYIANSTWIGGPVSDPGGLQERVPYYLNGAVPLAYLLDDQRLIDQVEHYVGYILDHQAEDGWFGPDCCDPWPRFSLLLSLTQYAETLADPSVVVKQIWLQLERLSVQLESEEPLRDWGKARWVELGMTIEWMARQGYGDQPTLRRLLQLVSEEQGIDWRGWVLGDSFPTVACVGSNQTYMSHGVNLAQGLKAPALSLLLLGEEEDRDSLHRDALAMVSRVNEYHGQATGMFSCSEHLAGTFPSAGSETCAVVEALYSQSVLFGAFGDVSFADRAEAIAYNALPGGISPDHWSHVYLQQANQINAKHNDPNVWVSDGPDSNMYGLEPNYGCCTANHVQGWPKFVSGLWMATADKDGLVAAAYAPSRLTTQLSGGRAVTVETITEYPFSGVVNMSISASAAFSLFLRVPHFATPASTVRMNGQEEKALQPGTLHELSVPAGETQVTLELQFEVVEARRYKGALALAVGPLTFALRFNETWTPLTHYAYESCDWEVGSSTAWAVGLVSNSSRLVRHGMRGAPFSPDTHPVSLMAKGALIGHSWVEERNAAGEPPVSPMPYSGGQGDPPLIEVELVPYGSTDLRISEFPEIVPV